ncbi:nuclear transport factor 2 family protein [Nonomuraea harbinensis]|uniref:Nuclear transport factor 2 family protein n=1 Tax=Nonomuraea harbinensis TaxID=1286938 RepID=A0ABW1BSK2_9ACTN|nr:nuclear transport factor 2 family protein [Nonomuraea harbinensis]
MGAREVFDGLRRHMTGEEVADLWAEDVVVETPFAPPDQPRRIEGRERFLAHARAGRAALPVALEMGEVTVHDTADPDMIVVEYELGSFLPGTGERLSVPFIGVLKARDGRIAHWREYQDVPAMTAALGRVSATC